MPHSPADAREPPAQLGTAATGFVSAFSRSLSTCIECARDNSEDVRQRLEQSLLSLAQKDFGMVLDATCRFLLEHKGTGSTPQHQRITLLRALKLVCLQYDEHISDKLVLDLTTCAAVDMTAAIEINSPWQNQASELAVDLCCINPAVAIPHIASLIPGTSLPHYFVLKSLSTAAERRPLRFLPHMRECMAKVLPILGMAKQDNVRYIFADTLASFADAISQLSSLPELSPRASTCSQFQIADFHDPMYTALSLILNEWANVRELRVRTTVVMALGKMALVIAPERLEEKLVPLVKHIMNGVQRERPRDALNSLRGATFFIRACMEKVAQACGPHLETIWQSIFKPVVQFHGLKQGDQTELLKNHQELMRCVEALASGVPDIVLNYIQKTLDPKFGTKDITTKCAALSVLQHLVQQRSLDEKLDPLKNHVVAIVRTILEDPDWRVKQSTVRIIMAMGAADANNYLACEGGESLVQYVVLLSAIPPHVCEEWNNKNKKAVAEGIAGPQDVSAIGRSVFNLMITTRPNLDLVMWPFVLEVFGMATQRPELVNIFVPLSNAIVQVGKRLGNTHDFYFDFEKKVNVPRPEALVAALLPAAAQAMRLGKDAVCTVLTAMETIAPLLDEPMKRTHDGTTPLGSLWLGTVPELREYVMSDEFVQSDYEEACYVLLKKTVTCKKEETWSQAVVAAFAAQCGQWCPSNMPAEFLKIRQDMKRVALVMFGLALSKVHLKTFVTDYINVLVEETDHTVDQQRTGCAKGLGYVSMQHTDAVLDKLTRVAKPPKAQGGGMFAKKVDAGPDRDYGELSRGTVLLSFGQVARRAPAELFRSRLETHVVPTLLELLQVAKSPVVKEAAFAGIQLLSTSLRKDTDLNFVSKANVMGAVTVPMMVDQPAALDPVAFSLLLEGVKALIPTTYLAPVCDSELLLRLKHCVAVGYSKLWMCATDMRAKPESEKPDKDKSPQRQPLPETVMVKQLGLLSCAVLESAPELTTSLIDQTTHMAPFLRSQQVHERERSSQSFVMLLKHFGKQVDKRGHDLYPVEKGPVELGGGEMPGAAAAPSPPPKKKSGKDSKGATPEQPAIATELSIGQLIARTIPRLADVSLKVRENAADALVLCLKLYMVTNGEEAGILKAIEVAKGLSGRLNYEDESAMVSVLKDVGAALCGFLGGGGKELPLLIDELIVRGLVDPVIDSAVAVCATVAQLFRNLGGVAQDGTASLTDDEVCLFAEKLIAALGAITGPDGNAVPGREDAHRGILLSIKAVAKNRPTLIFNHILTYPVSHAPNITKAVQTLANDSGLSRLITNHCLDVLLNAQLFEEGYTSGSQKLSLCLPVIAAVCTLGEVFETAKGAEVAKALQAPLICGMLLLQAASHEAPRVHLTEKQQAAQGGAPVRAAALVNVAIRSFAHAVYSHSLNERAQRGVWAQLESQQGFPAGCAQLVTFLIHESHEEGDKDTMHDESGYLMLPPTTDCPLVVELFDFMKQYVQKVYDCHRWCAMTILGQLLYHCMGSDTLLQGIVHALLSRAGADERIPIKLQSVRGYGHLPVHPYEAIKVFVAPVIASLIACCADASLDVCLISMATLENFIQRIGCKTELSAVVVNICLRTKTCLDLPDPRMRGAGCSLFGVMCKLSTEGMIDYGVMEQNVNGHLAGLLVHVNDCEPQVRVNCKAALHEVVAWLNASPPSKKARDHMDRLFSKEHVSPNKQTNYDEFANEFAKVWVRHYEERINDLLVALASYFQSPWPPVRAAAAILCGCVLRHLSNADQARSNLESTCAGLNGLLRKDPDSIVRLKAAKALGMLGDMR